MFLFLKLFIFIYDYCVQKLLAHFLLQTQCRNCEKPEKRRYLLHNWIDKIKKVLLWIGLFIYIFQSHQSQIP